MPLRRAGDVHRQTSALIFGVPEDQVTPDQRRVGKTINFGVAYGMSSFGLARAEDSSCRSGQVHQGYFQRFEGVDRFLKETINSAEDTGFVRTLMGRRAAWRRSTAGTGPKRAAQKAVAVNSRSRGRPRTS